MQIDMPTPLDYFATLVAEDESLPLTEAAVALAQDEFPDLDLQATLAEIDALAARLKRRVPVDAGAVHRLRLLNHYFFQELGFGGNVNDYYDPHNSCLNVVLRTRRGIPISLAVLYMELAGQVGLRAHGVSFPGHFLVKLRMPRGEVVMDPFSGLSLSREELDDRLEPYKRQRGLVGEFDMPLGLFLQAASPREVLARMLRNLKEIYRAREEAALLLRTCERLVVLLPDSLDERRDRGLAYAQTGRDDEAIADLSVYVSRADEAEDRLAIAERLDELQRGRTRPRWH